MKDLKTFLGLLLTLVAILGLTQACSSADEAVDCAELCANYEVCETSNFDTSECTSVCESRADVSDDFAAEVDACEECIDGNACAEQDACASACAGVTLPDEDDSSEGNAAEAEACLSACTNYEVCSEEAYDVSSCTTACEDQADADPTGFAEDVLACDDCIDDVACADQNCPSCDALGLATLGDDNPSE